MGHSLRASRYVSRSRRSTAGETSWGKSTIEHRFSGSRRPTPRTTAALARMWPLPMALERIRISALFSLEAMVALYW